MKFYDDDHQFNIVSNGYDTEITVIDEDTFTAAAQEHHPCCLNFASHKRPGGGYKSVMNLRMPIKTQEEDLFRRSDLPNVMDNRRVRQYYPLMGVKGLYCSAVVDKDKNLDPIIPFQVSLVTVAAIVNPKPDEQPLTEAKIRRVLDIAADNNQQTLILGAWGCGAFRNDPEVVASLFKKHLEGDFQGVFQKVIFAIPGEASHNHQVFLKHFS